MDTKDTEVDFKIHDAYVAFSSEIIRIALLSPLVFPFFAAFAGKDPKQEDVLAVFAPARCSLSLGLICMAVAVFFGLLHRYFAVDFISDYIERERKKAPPHSLIAKKSKPCSLIAKLTVDPEKLAALTIAKIDALTIAKIDALTITQTATLTDTQIANLTAEQISKLTLRQIAALTDTQIANITDTQIDKLTKRLKTLKLAAQIAKLDKSCKRDLKISTLAIIAAPFFLFLGASCLFKAVFQILTGVLFH